MTFLQIQYFIEVCRTGSTLKASQALNVSQSTISSAIKTLEDELGAALFDRTSKGMTPNAAGRLFRPAFDPDPVPAEKYRRRLPSQGHYPLLSGSGQHPHRGGNRPFHHLSGLVAQRCAGSRAETAVFRI